MVVVVVLVVVKLWGLWCSGGDAVGAVVISH